MHHNLKWQSYQTPRKRVHKVVYVCVPCFTTKHVGRLLMKEYTIIKIKAFATKKIIRKCKYMKMQDY